VQSVVTLFELPNALVLVLVLVILVA